MKNILLTLVLLLCVSAHAAIDCLPAEAGGSADYIRPLYVGGTRAFAFVWLCGNGTWSWVAMRWTGPDVIWGPDAISGLATLRMIEALHKAEPAFMLGELAAYLPTPHN